MIQSVLVLTRWTRTMCSATLQVTGVCRTKGISKSRPVVLSDLLPISAAETGGVYQSSGQQCDLLVPYRFRVHQNGTCLYGPGPVGCNCRFTCSGSGCQTS